MSVKWSPGTVTVSARAPAALARATYDVAWTSGTTWSSAACTAHTGQVAGTSRVGSDTAKCAGCCSGPPPANSSTGTLEPGAAAARVRSSTPDNETTPA